MTSSSSLTRAPQSPRLVGASVWWSPALPLPCSSSRPSSCSSSLVLPFVLPFPFSSPVPTFAPSPLPSPLPAAALVGRVGLGAGGVVRTGPVGELLVVAKLLSSALDEVLGVPLVRPLLGPVVRPVGLPSGEPDGSREGLAPPVAGVDGDPD